jgi:hypothetical protein
VPTAGLLGCAKPKRTQERLPIGAVDPAWRRDGGRRVAAVAPVGLGVIAGCGSWVLLLLMGLADTIISTNRQSHITTVLEN